MANYSASTSVHASVDAGGVAVLSERDDDSALAQCADVKPDYCKRTYCPTCRYGPEGPYRDGCSKHVSAFNYCKGTCGIGPPCDAEKMDIAFAGAKHGRGEDMSANLRPEAVKSIACNGNICDECTDETGCWHGTYTHGWEYLGLDVPANSPHNLYRGELWMKCTPGSTATWKVHISKLENGRLLIYANSELVETVKFASFSKTVILPVTKDTLLHFDFIPNTPSLAAFALIRPYVLDVDVQTDTCMAHKLCLQELGDGSSASFELRNTNIKLLQCLEASDDAARAAVSSKCIAFSNCLITVKEKRTLRIWLRSALVPSVTSDQRRKRRRRRKRRGKGQPRRNQGSLIRENATHARSQFESHRCLDPSIDDLMALECDCLWNIKKSCGGVNETCFREVMCSTASICCSWKRLHCPSPVSCAHASLAKSDASMESTTHEEETVALPGFVQNARRVKVTTKRRSVQERSALASEHIAGGAMLDNTMDGALRSKCGA